MGTVAIYAGSFNPFHRGHLDTVKKALKVFDKIIVARGINPEKKIPQIALFSTSECSKEIQKLIDNEYVEIDNFEGLLSDFIEGLVAESDGLDEFAIIKGLRNGQDLEYEKDQQYWNEDLGIDIPFFYIIADRNNCHVSSKAIRGLEKFGVRI